MAGGEVIQEPACLGLQGVPGIHAPSRNMVEGIEHGVEGELPGRDPDERLDSRDPALSFTRTPGQPRSVTVEDLQEHRSGHGIEARSQGEFRRTTVPREGCEGIVAEPCSPERSLRLPGDTIPTDLPVR